MEENPESHLDQGRWSCSFRIPVLLSPNRSSGSTTHDASDQAPMQQAAPVECNPQVRAGWLPTEEARFGISQAIRSRNEGQALCSLDEMESGVAKTEECERLYGYAIKEKKFDLATSVVERCWKGTIKQRHLRDIWHEKLKQ